MALKDLKSDLTKAFKRIPAGGKLEKMVQDPHASQLDYSAEPKPYRIPNDGRGGQVKYDPTTGEFKSNSILGQIQNTSALSGRHKSNVDLSKPNPAGRHENVDKEIKEMAPTPAKTAVEPIAMSATPPKQGLSPKPMSEPVEKVGTNPDKIPISGYVDNQPPNIDNVLYSLDVGEGALAQLGGASKFDIDELTKPYFTSGDFTTNYFTVSNNVIIGTPSSFDVDGEPVAYAPSGYVIDRLSRYFTPVRDAIDLNKEFGTTKSNNMQLTGEIDTHNPSIQIHGSNIVTPYDLDLESVLSSDSMYEQSDVKAAFSDVVDDENNAGSGLRFFSDHSKVDPEDETLASHIPSNGGITLDDQLNDIHSGFTGANTIPVEYNLNWFGNSDGTVASYYTGETLSVYNSTGESPSKLNINGQGIGNDPQGLEGLNGGLLHYITLSEQIDDELGQTLNMFNQNGGAHMVTGTSSPFVEYNIRGFRTSQNPNGGQNPQTTPAIPGYLKNNGDRALTDFNFLDLDALTTDEFFAKGRIGFESGASVFRTFDETQNFFNQDNPIIADGFTPYIGGDRPATLTGPWWNWNLSNTEKTEYEWIQNEDNNPSIFSIDQDSNSGMVNFFDPLSLHATGFVTPNTAILGDWANWVQWSSGADMPSHFTGITEGNYDNPSIYANLETYDIFTPGTNFFDSEQKYTLQFTRNVQDPASSFGSSNYVNISDDQYDPLTISNDSNYSFSTLFNVQLDYWSELPLYSGLNRFEHEDGIESFGHIISNKYASSGLHPDPDNTAGNSFSDYTDETNGIFEHETNENWSYYTMIGIGNSAWGSGIGNFRPNYNGAIPIRTEHSVYRYLDNGMSSWIETTTELGGDEFESVEDNLIYHHPDYKPTGIGGGVATYGYGLGLTQHLKYWENSIVVGSGTYIKNIAFRNPMGLKHVTYLEGDQLIVNKENAWLSGGYIFGPNMYGTKAGLSSGGVMGISTGRDTSGGDLWLNPLDIEHQLFTAAGTGVDSMGGKSYEERMMLIYTQNTQQRSTVGSILNNLNPFDNIKNIWDNMKNAWDDTIKRWWMQHNRFAIQMSNNPPKGTHQGLPGDSATNVVGQFGGMLNSVSTGGADLISTITGLSARKYWSVQHYPGLQISAEIVDTGITRFNDFRMFISDMGAVHVGLSGASNYLNNNIHKRYGYPASGQPGVPRKMYYKFIPGMGDDITMEQFFTGDKLDSEAPNDYINFQLKDVVNDQTWRFRAYISGLTDSIQPNWSQYNYIGRPDPVFQYNGASARSISFNLKVAALAQQDMYWMWKKINKMIGMCYPSGYEPGKFMTGPMMKLTLGEYVVMEPGFLNALTISVPDDSPWEINQMHGSGGPFSDLGSAVGTVTNIANDPVGSLVNFGASFATTQETPIAARKNNKNYAFNEFGADSHETKGDLLAQLPHIVNLSIGYTLIGNQNKNSKGTHIGWWNREFFKGYDKDTTNTDAGDKTKAGQVLDFLGL